MNDAEFANAARACPENEEHASEFFNTISTDYEAFVKAVWINRKLDRVSILDEVALDMLDFACHGPRRREILAFRGEGKTHKVSACLSCYRLRRDPNRKVFVISKSQTEAKKTLSLIRGWITKVWFLEDLRPTQTEKWRRDNATQFDVGPSTEHRQASVTALGVDGQIEGNRAHTIIPDDIETKGNSKTRDARDALRRIANEFTNVLYPDNDQTSDPVEIVAVGTPKSEETIYLELINQGFACRSYPIQYPRPDERVICMAPFLTERIDRGLAVPGQPTCPDRFGLMEIADRAKSGYTEFAMEFMLIADLASTNRHPLRLSDLIVYPVHRDKAPVAVAWGQRDHNGSTASSFMSLGLNQDRLYGPVHVDPLWVPYDRTAAALDPSGRGTDKTGLCIAGTVAGCLWVKYAKGLPGGADDLSLDLIAAALRTHNATELFLESNIDAFGTFQASVERAISRHRLEPGDNPAFPQGWICSVTPVHNSGQKELRIIGTLEPVFSVHRAVFDPSVFDPPAEEHENDLQYQISRITRDRKCLPEDGLIDSLEVLARHLCGSTNMARSSKELSQDSSDRYFESVLRQFHHDQGSQPTEEPAWFGRIT